MKNYIVCLLIGGMPLLSLQAFPGESPLMQEQDTLDLAGPQDTIDWLIEQSDEDTLQHNRVIQKIDEHGDTTYIKLGKKRIQIVEEDDETSLNIKDLEVDDYDAFEDELPDKSWKDFKGHWAGFEVGLNNFVNKDFSLNRNAESEFMDINTGKSWNFNLNFAQYSLGFGSYRIGLVTGLGLEWNNYHFNNDNSVEKLNGEILPKAIPPTTYRNRLQTTYLTVPFIFEYQFPGKSRNDRVFIGAGVIGGLKLFSNTKIKYTEDGSKRKSKDKSDFYLAPLRYGFTARAGYKMVKLYADYYPVPLFLENRGPELYPVAAGLLISF
jgi:hypothetical protein